MKDTEIPKDKNIKLISMHDEMSSSYLSYAMSVIVSSNFGDNVVSDEDYNAANELLLGRGYSQDWISEQDPSVFSEFQQFF